MPAAVIWYTNAATCVRVHVSELLDVARAQMRMADRREPSRRSIAYWKRSGNESRGLRAIAQESDHSPSMPRRRNILPSPWRETPSALRRDHGAALRPVRARPDVAPLELLARHLERRARSPAAPRQLRREQRSRRRGRAAARAQPSRRSRSAARGRCPASRSGQRGQRVRAERRLRADASAACAPEVLREQRDVSDALAQRRHGDSEHVEPEAEVGPEPSVRRPRVRAAGWWPRRSGRRRGAAGSRRRGGPLLPAARAAAWPGPGADSSPTSSRNSVPPSASSNSPARSVAAPVNAPRVWPNSSASSSSSLERRAVDRAEAPVCARRQPMDGARDQLLAAAALPFDQHRERRPRRAVNVVAQRRRGALSPSRSPHTAGGGAGGVSSSERRWAATDRPPRAASPRRRQDRWRCRRSSGSRSRRTVPRRTGSARPLPAADGGVEQHSLTAGEHLRDCARPLAPRLPCRRTDPTITRRRRHAAAPHARRPPPPPRRRPPCRLLRRWARSRKFSNRAGRPGCPDGRDACRPERAARAPATNRSTSRWQCPADAFEAESEARRLARASTGTRARARGRRAAAGHAGGVARHRPPRAPCPRAAGPASGRLLHKAPRP